jgi:hypothetical protein
MFLTNGGNAGKNTIVITGNNGNNVVRNFLSMGNNNTMQKVQVNFFPSSLMKTQNKPNLIFESKAEAYPRVTPLKIS